MDRLLTRPLALLVTLLLAPSLQAEVRVIANLVPEGDASQVEQLAQLVGGDSMHVSATQLLIKIDENQLPALALSPHLSSVVTDAGCADSIPSDCLEAPVVVTVSVDSPSDRDIAIQQIEGAGGEVSNLATLRFTATGPAALLDVAAASAEISFYDLLSLFGPFPRAATPSPVLEPPPLNLGEGHRFFAQAYFDTGSNLGVGAPRLINEDSGGMTFFDGANLEILVKVLDACAINNHYWVFVSGLTDVEVTLIVGDRRDGAERQYENFLGSPFELVRDVNAFVCQ